MVLCAGAFGCYAAQGSLPGAQGQGYDLNLSYSRTTLKAVADAITQQVGIAFSYETALAGYPMENLEVSEKGATIEAILATVFTPRGIDYRVVDKVVVLTRSTRPVPAARAAAKSEVKGVVRDAAGNPMIGVTVTIKGTLVGVSTGVDGGYAIPADGNATLLFSYIGYRPHEEVVGRRTQIDVTMQEDELVMDEVVVVGYGTLKKRNIVGAVENLSGDAVENRPNANITRSLQGQIPGLNIVQVDGKADHAGEVTIRGVNNTFKARVSGGEKTNKLGQGGGALVLIDGAEGEYSKELSAFHETSWYYYSPTYGAKIAMTKKFMNTYLTTRGTPFTDIDGYQTIDFIREFDGRDARMAQTVISPTYKMKISGRERLYSPNWKVTRTGYHPIKWSIDDDADNVLSKAASWNSLPILRYAEVLLNYAEAKAELGEMDAAVWDQTIAQLRSRAGVTPVVPDKADPYMEAYFLNTVTDKWILEVRRERGIELCLEMGLRWDDDMRWHMGDLLTSDNNPWTGIWIGNTGYTYDFTGQSTDDNGDPVPDFYIRPGEDTEHSIAISNTGANQTFSLNAAGNIVWEYKRTWGEKKYLRPIPQTAITRNPNLEQNALWK